ncbi:hydrogenase expression/formation C-terminal domain-containing protein [Tropicimonas sp. TH_r6]|uniref:hydrogenase expression/formation C-terminal domain-containing protein n=1 Tax=Tropicimonas sp. TH_r6 TaxID=3082085 RepID=UPI002952CD3E|nr:hydrogenase expression/formation C-terminal domain-containing protein [Tropicimonas sp. TH_r6]MDV7145427.1 hydrogenase expression/formation C-terminal domain-containing protein [Tropicimonas sp. TH_r6]
MQNSSNSGADLVQLKEAVANLPTGNAPPILSEILDALGRLIDRAEPTVIDLGAIPFTGGDEKVLQEILGNGEVNAVLDAMGESHVQETGIPGVWRVDHCDPKGEIQSRFIEITFVPDILKTQSEDAQRGQEMLAERLSERLSAIK